MCHCQAHQLVLCLSIVCFADVLKRVINNQVNSKVGASCRDTQGCCRPQQGPQLSPCSAQHQPTLPCESTCKGLRHGRAGGTAARPALPQSPKVFHCSRQGVPSCNLGVCSQRILLKAGSLKDFKGMLGHEHANCRINPDRCRRFLPSILARTW